MLLLPAEAAAGSLPYGGICSICGMMRCYLNYIYTHLILYHNVRFFSRKKSKNIQKKYGKNMRYPYGLTGT